VADGGRAQRVARRLGLIHHRSPSSRSGCDAEDTKILYLIESEWATLGVQKPCGGTLATAGACGANAVRLANYAANVSDQIARAEFEALSAEWARLAILAHWQAHVRLDSRAPICRKVR
jgi:hypothetical protein